jgi:hypothetical protein
MCFTYPFFKNRIMFTMADNPEIPQEYYITPEGLTIFNAGCNPAKKHELVCFLACIFS